MSSIKTVDKWFSLYIRKRDTKKGYGHCCTCGNQITFETCDAGHFMSREHKSTRWNEQNAHAQCRPCNRFKSGKQYEHGLFIDNKYGQGTAIKLNFLSKVPNKYMKHELKAMADHFRKLYNQIK